MLSLPDHHLNDPSVVTRPQDGALLMFATSAPYDAINTISLFGSFDAEQWSFWGHQILDGGSPSALVVGNEVWVYYTPMNWPPQQVHRRRFGPWGVNALGPPEALTAGGDLWAIGNIDVAPFRDGYVAVGNRTLNEVWIAFSSNGVNFGPPQPLIITDALVTAPHINVLTEDYLTISFSFSAINTDTAHHFESHDWMYRVVGTFSPVPAWPSLGVCTSAQAPPTPLPLPPPPGPLDEHPWWCTFSVEHPECSQRRRQFP
jgi:hypothetical protein